MATQTQIQQHSDLIDSILDDFDEFMESAEKTLENKVAKRILETKNTWLDYKTMKFPNASLRQNKTNGNSQK